MVNLSENLVNENYIIQWGKFKGKNIIDEFEKNKPYFCWCFNQPFIKKYEDIYKFLENEIKDPNEIYMTFGKHKNKSLSWIKQNDEKYILYLKTNDFVKEKMINLWMKL